MIVRLEGELDIVIQDCVNLEMREHLQSRQ